MKKQVKILVALAALLVVGLFATNTPVYANDSDYVRVELVPPGHWSGVGAWGWDSEECDVNSGAGWPENPVPWDEDAGAYVFSLPAYCAPFTMFFMDTADNYDRVPAHGTGYLHIEGDMRIVMGGLRVEFLPPASWEAVGAWGWGDNCDVMGGAAWPGEPVPWDETAQAYVFVVDEECAPFTMFFMDHVNNHARFPAYGTGYLEIEGNTRFDASGLRLGFTHPNWSQVYVVAWDNNGSLEGFETGVPMSFDDELDEWYVSIGIEGVEMPFTVYFHNGAGERTANRPVTRPDTVPYERVRYVPETDDTDVDDLGYIEIEAPTIELDVQDDEDTDNTVLFIVIGAVVVVAVIAVVATKKKK